MGKGQGHLLEITRTQNTVEGRRQAQYMGLQVAVRSAFRLMALPLRKVPVAGSVPWAPTQTLALHGRCERDPGLRFSGALT